MSYWGLRITFCDEANNRFLTLGGAAWKTERERDRHFAAVPAADPSSPFMLDLENEDGLVGEKPIDEKTVHQLLGKSAAVAIADAAKELERMTQR